ncbi:hypothetical protein [Candidatus Binatus sp.]|uniref:hypothetical protein n=1 Tax=Candidatus Binatus sp. TaxID=2811406 RepID=UPI003BAE26E8
MADDFHLVRVEINQDRTACMWFALGLNVWNPVRRDAREALEFKWRQSSPDLKIGRL